MPTIQNRIGPEASMFDWGDLKQFLAVAETGSLSAAAKELGQSQPTVGRRIDALESRLGAQLFVRTASGVTLTDLGRTALAYARRVRDEAAAIERAAENQDTALEGTVRVSTIEGIAAQWMTPELGAFRRLYPDIDLELIAEDTAADLANRHADIAIRLFRPVEPSLITRRLATIHYGFYAHKAFLDRHGRPRTVAELSRYDFVGWDEAPGTRAKQESLRENAHVTAQPVFRTNSPGTMVAAVDAGIGVGRLPVSMAEGHDRLERLFPDLVAAELDVWLVAHAELRANARIRALWDFIIARTETYRRTRAGFG
ncbi:hypothetical protein CKO24_09360 [Rhodothalassium salexigens DSM 2132]|nr:hypothetical protein [Rhodothalassium salexigens DSM 2132]